MERLLVCPGDPGTRLQVRQPAGRGLEALERHFHAEQMIA
jgi:hypothetical protein